MQKRFSGSTKLIALVIAIITLALGSFWLLNSEDSSTANKKLGCGSKQPGVIIFYYREGTSDNRLNDIIKSVDGSVEYNYSSLHGFAIKVPEGSEDDAITTLKKNAEVGTVSQSRLLCTQSTTQ